MQESLAIASLMEDWLIPFRFDFSGVPATVAFLKRSQSLEDWSRLPGQTSSGMKEAAGTCNGHLGWVKAFYL
jgi:hypothetical protein